MPYGYANCSLHGLPKSHENRQYVYQSEYLGIHPRAHSTNSYYASTPDTVNQVQFGPRNNSFTGMRLPDLESHPTDATQIAHLQYHAGFHPTTLTQTRYHTPTIHNPELQPFNPTTPPVTHFARTLYHTPNTDTTSSLLQPQPSHSTPVLHDYTPYYASNSNVFFPTGPTVPTLPPLSQVAPEYFSTAGSSSNNYDHSLHWPMKKEAINRPSIQQLIYHPNFWNWEYSIQFLVNVARTLCGKGDSNRNSIRLKIDQAYLERMQLLQHNSNWISKMGRKRYNLLILQKTSIWRSKNYDGNSVMSLVELIRDKFMHPEDLVDELLTEENFGEGRPSELSEEKYTNYFLTTFPDLVIFLFCTLANERSVSINILRKRYFSHLDEMPLMPDMAQ